MARFDKSCTCASCEEGGGFAADAPLRRSRPVQLDPTHTGKLRRDFTREFERRFRDLKRLTRQALVEHDVLALRAATVANVGHASNRIDTFSAWFRAATTDLLIEREGSWLTRYVSGGYNAGIRHIEKELGRRPQPDNDNLRALATACVHEVRGIASAVETAAIRAVAVGLSRRHSPQAMAREVGKLIDKTGARRARILVEMTVVRSHADASLDCLRAEGMTHVELVAEASAVRRDEARRTTDAKRRRSRPENWREFLRFRTQQDDDVCPECEDLEGEVYHIDEAYGIIPVHPNCRCVFVPHFDRRYAEDGRAA